MPLPSSPLKPRLLLFDARVGARAAGVEPRSVVAAKALMTLCSQAVALAWRDALTLDERQVLGGGAPPLRVQTAYPLVDNPDQRVAREVRAVVDDARDARARPSQSLFAVLWYTLATYDLDLNLTSLTSDSSWPCLAWRFLTQLVLRWRQASSPPSRRRTAAVRRAHIDALQGAS